MNTKVKWIIGIIVVILAIWGLSRGSGAPVPDDNGEPVSGEPIKIGFIGPLTGDAANIGQNARAAVEIAVSEINGAGGIGGRPLEVIYEDGQCTGATAANAANKLINIDKVPVIIGGACSSESSAFTGLAEQTKTVTLSYCSSVPALTDAGDYFFRNYPSDSYQGAFAANYAFQTLQKPKVAVLYVKADWGVGIHDVFVREFTALGGQIAADEGYEQTSRDLRTQLAKIKASSPDLIYFLGYTEASIPGIRQIAELGIKVPVLGGDAWDDVKIWTDAGAAGEEMMYIVPAAAQASFVEKFKTAKPDNEVSICVANAYDAVNIIADAMKKVGPVSEQIKNELYTVRDYPGVSGVITFDQNGDLAQADYLVKIVKNGAAEPYVAE